MWYFFINKFFLFVVEIAVYFEREKYMKIKFSHLTKTDYRQIKSVEYELLMSQHIKNKRILNTFLKKLSYSIKKY